MENKLLDRKDVKIEKRCKNRRYLGFNFII